MNGRNAVAVLALALALPVSGRGQSVQLLPQSPVVQLVNVGIEHNLLSFMAMLQVSLDSEVALCLTEGPDSVIRGFRAPTMMHRDTIGVTFACPTGTPGMVGYWHMHPMEHGDCDFSAQDRATFERSRLAISILSCGTGEFRYMLRGIHEVVAFDPGATKD